MKLLRTSVLLLTLASSAVFAKASTITYNLSNVGTTFSDGNSLHGTLTGTLTVDPATDLVTTARLVFNDPTYGNPTFTTISSSAAYNGLSQAYIAAPSSGQQNYGGLLALFFNTASIGTGNLSICTSGSACGTAGVQPSSIQVYSNHGNLTYNLTGGTLESVQPTPTALTPEPSSLFLLGTGILAVAGSMLIWPSGAFARRHAPQLKTPA